ncbi:MAG: hypothetical protein J5871_05010 [Bacteroidales bacterium]|nr:hypothetical protein [Bacteroidales bacterium]
MKGKILRMLWGALLLCPLSAAAQTAGDAGKDAFYLQGYIGTNKSANENLPWSELTPYPWSGGLFFGIGQELTPLWGWRAALRLNHNKSRNVRTCESYDTWGWYNTGLFADATFDVSDVFRRQERREGAVFNLKAFAGAGLAYTYGFDKVPLSYTHPYLRQSLLLPGFRTGLTATFRLSENWRIGTELSHSWYADRFNGVAYESPLDGRTNLKLGVTCLLVRKRKEPVQVVRNTRLRECPELPFAPPVPEPLKVRRIVGRAFLDFPVNETVIYPEYRKNPGELARIQSSVDSALFDKSVTVTGISLHGYASPESPYANNTRLASGRVEALKSYLVRQYAFPDSVFTTAATPEDWGNLRGFLENTEGRRVKGDLWYDGTGYVETPRVPDFILQYRDELIAVIDKDMDPDEKELLLKKVGGGEPYRWLHKHVYPGLRHTDYIIEYEIKAYPVKDGRRLIYSHPEALSLREMYEVSQSYETGSEGWFDAFVIAARQYPADETAQLNAACACLKTKRLADARKYLKRAGGSQGALYVADVLLAMEGKTEWHMENGRVIISP